MRDGVTALVATGARLAGLATTAALHADDTGSARSHRGSMTAPGMMGQEGMMGQMPQMTDHGNQMMQSAGDGGSGKPNEQWRRAAPDEPENNG